MRSAIACVIVAAVVASQPVRADDFVKPVVRWSGTVEDAGKVKAMPASGAVTSQEAFDKLWTAWQVGRDVPFIDFDSHFVVVVAGGDTVTLIHLMVDGKGVGRDVKGDGAERKGFGYSLGVFPRAGIKTYGGEDVAPRK